VKQPMSVSLVNYTPPLPVSRQAALTSYSHQLGEYDLYWLLINTGVEAYVFAESVQFSNTNLPGIHERNNMTHKVYKLATDAQENCF